MIEAVGKGASAHKRSGYWTPHGLVALHQVMLLLMAALLLASRVPTVEARLGRPEAMAGGGVEVRLGWMVAWGRDGRCGDKSG